MKNVKQKFSSCHRAAMLTVLAVLLSCLPIGKALAWEVGQTFMNNPSIVVREDATFKMMGAITKAEGTDIEVEIQAIILTLNPGYDHSDFLLPATCPDPEDSEITMKIKTYNIQMLADESFNPFNTSIFTSFTVSEGVEQFGCFYQFPNVNTVNLSSTVQTGPFPLYYMGALENINVAAGNPYHSSKNDGILYDASGEQLQCLHQNKCTGTSLVIPEGVKSIQSAYSIAVYEYLEEITLPSTFDTGLPIDFRDGCSELTTIHVSPKNTKYYEVDGVLCEKYQKSIPNENYDDGEEEYILGPVQNKLVFYPKGRTASSYSVPTDASAGEGKGIDIIGEYAFYKSQLSSVDLGNVSTLEDYAFYYCLRNLTLTIPASLVDIAPDAFYQTKITNYVVEDGNPIYYVDGNGILYENERVSSEERIKVLKSVPQLFVVASTSTFEIPENVVIIGEAAFKNCTNVKGKIKIRKNVTTIRKEAFMNCQLNAVEFETGSELSEIQEGSFRSTNLTTITLPETVTKIGDYAFADNKFTSFTIPEHITSIGKFAFDNNTKLTNVTFENDDLKSIPQHCFDNCTNLTIVKFPANCETIESYAFAKCNISDEDFIPSTIKKIGDHAFDNCKFTSLNLPDGLESIGNSAFFNCSGLTEITIPASVSEIKGNAFGCDKWTSGGITTVTIKNGSLITNIFDNPFGTRVQTVNFEGSSALTKIGQNAFKNCESLESFNCPDGVMEIATRAFMNCNNATFTRFDFPNAVKYIRQEAFSGCTNLATIAFNKESSELESIGKNAFYNCAVNDITFPNSLKNIEFEAFRHCENLEEVTLPALIQNVNGGSFNYCPKLENYYVEELVYPEGATDEEKAALKAQVKYSAVGGYLLSSNKETLCGFPEAKANKNFTLLPPSVCDIGDYAFYCCEGLENVTIPNKVTSISGVRAFGQCTNLKTITFLCDEMIDPANIQRGEAPLYNDRAFDGEDGGTIAGKTIYVRKDLLTDYQNCDFYNVATIIPSFEEDVRDFAADWETAKKDEEVNEYINVSENVVSMIGTKSKDHTFVLSPSVKHVYNDGEDAKTLSVELIGDYAFQNAAADIEEVVVMDYIKYIGANAFITSLAADAPSENTSTIERIFFVNTKPDTEYKTEDKLTSMISTTRFKLKEEDLVGGKDYREFLPVQRIFVKKSMLDDYKKYWPEYADQMDYRIRPLTAKTVTAKTRAEAEEPTETKYDFIKIEAGKKYATFSREFDVDLGEYAREKKDESFDIKAFTTGVLRGGSGRPQDYPEENNDHNAPYHLKMYHIGYDSDAADAKEYNKGTYVPNNTGVLLAVMNGWGGTPSDYFYCIHEDDNGGTRNADNTGNGTLRKSVEAGLYKLPAITAVGGKYHPTQWVMQGGVFRPVKGADVYLPAHKAWLYLDMDELESDASAPASAIAFSFSLDSFSEDTGVDAPELTTATAADGIYTLTGVKVQKPEGKGIYIVNGKKMVIK